MKKKKSSQISMFDLFAQPPVDNDVPVAPVDQQTTLSEFIVDAASTITTSPDFFDSIPEQPGEQDFINKPELSDDFDSESIPSDSLTLEVKAPDLELTFSVEPSPDEHPPASLDDEDLKEDIIPELVFELYVSDTCPNCPDVKQFVRENFVEQMGTVYNVSQDPYALPMARKRQVLDLPSFLIVNTTSDTIVARAGRVEDIVKVLKETVNYIPTVADLRAIVD